MRKLKISIFFFILALIFTPLVSANIPLNDSWVASDWNYHSGNILNTNDSNLGTFAESIQHPTTGAYAYYKLNDTYNIDKVSLYVDLHIPDQVAVCQFAIMTSTDNVTYTNLFNKTTNICGTYTSGYYRWINMTTANFTATDATYIAIQIHSGGDATYGARLYEVVFNGTVVPPSSDPYASVTVKDLYDNATLSGLTVYIGTDSNTTDGSGTATVWNPTGLNYTIHGGTHYFNASGTATENATITGYVYGALLNLSAFNIEGTNILTFNVTAPSQSNTTATGWSYLLLPPNTTTAVNVTATDYYTGQFNITTGSRDTSEQNLTGLYQTIVNVTAKNAFSNETLSNWTGWIYNNLTGYNETFNTTGNVSVLYALLGNHTTYIDVFGYEIGTNNYEYSNFTNTTENVTFELYSENSIYVNIFNEETGARIYENITIVVSGNSTEDTYHTTNSTLFVENLTDGNYSLKFSGTNYSQRTYEVTVANRASQTLNAYLSPGTDTVTFALLDYDTSQAVEGATILQQRLLNSTWTTIESKSSDITGRAQFTYTIGVKYRFSITHPDYNAKVFELDPVIFTSYNIRLQKDEALDVNVGLFDVSFYYFPNYLTNDENNSFTITFGSAGGTLQSYGFVLNYPGGSVNNSGNSANGQTFNNGSFLVTGASYGDLANLTYWYDTTLAGNKTYNFQLFIQNAANNQTIFNNNNEDYGLGTLEKILIAVVVTIIFAGVLTLFGNVVVGLIAGLISMVIFVTIGFLTFWLVIPTVLLAVLMIMRRAD